MAKSNKSDLFNIGNWIVWPLGLLTILALVFSFAGYFGKVHHLLDDLSHAKVQYLMVSVFSLTFFALMGRRKWLLVSLFCVGMNLVEILPWYIPPLGAANPTSGEPMRVLLFNVLHTNQRFDDTIAFVKQEQPAIAVFLEATKPWPKKLEALQEFMPYRAIAKKLQIEIYSTLPLPNPTIQLYGTYRGNVVLDLTINGTPITFIASHAYPQHVFGLQGFQWRNQQIEELGDYVANLKKPVVITGDLNTTMWSPYYRDMIKKSGLRNARAGFGVLPTLYLRPGLTIPVDHCLVSSEIGVINQKKSPDLGSDHFSLVTDLAIPVPQVGN
jgi:endonuclease/exonuclease/phosphatase (EEP) superfamily protein YafD